MKSHLTSSASHPTNQPTNVVNEPQTAANSVTQRSHAATEPGSFIQMRVESRFGRTENTQLVGQFGLILGETEAVLAKITFANATLVPKDFSDGKNKTETHIIERYDALIRL